MEISQVAFGRTPDGLPVDLFALRSNRVEVRLMNYGAIITSVCVPDRDGGLDNIVLGHDCLEPYLSNPAYLGAVVGRFANRIAHGHFVLGGMAHQLAINEEGHHLHGGIRGFDQQLWSASVTRTPAHVGVRLSRTSPDGEEEYPGALTVTVAYCLDAAGDFSIQYEASTAAPTIVNLTQHTYFNLAAGRNTDVLEHELMLEADLFTPVRAGLIPTGAVVPVAGTAFDFRSPTFIGARLAEDDAQLRIAAGYDHNWVLRGGQELPAVAARVREPRSGRTLQVATTEPGIHFYSGNQLDEHPERTDGTQLQASRRLLP